MILLRIVLDFIYKDPLKVNDGYKIFDSLALHFGISWHYWPKEPFIFRFLILNKKTNELKIAWFYTFAFIRCSSLKWKKNSCCIFKCYPENQI